MPKFENAQNINSAELNPNEIPTNVEVPLMITKDMEQQLASKGLSSEEINKLKPEDAWEIISGKNEVQHNKNELSSEEQLKNLEGEVGSKQEAITRLSESIEDTKSALNSAREKLGLPPTEEEPPSISGDKNQLEKLEAEQEALEKQKNELVNKQEKERLIREEKERILQEKLNELFKEFEEFNPDDFESISKTGKTPQGRNMESKSMGSLNPEVAQSLAKAFKEGIKSFSKIIESLPELLKKLDEDLAEEATERVDKKLEEEKQKMEEELKREEIPEEPKLEENPEATKEGIPSGDIKSEAGSIEGGSIETPKM